MDSASPPTVSKLPESFDRFRSALADRYQIEREAGRGGMATVYLARDLKHGRHVAVKVLHEDYAHAIGAERFLREIETAARLQHPHIIGVYDSGEAAGLLYYVMPYVEGETLRQLLDREKQLPIAESIRIASHVADALAYAHIHGIVHRDIKPENILLGGTDASVADFGIAKAIHSVGEERLTSSGLSAGTPAYMSPEQAAGDRDLDGRSDVYSLGCVLFEMLAGVPPYHGANAQAVLTRHMTEPPPKIRSFRSAASPALERVLVRAMAKTRADRYSTAGEFEAALVAAQGTGDVGTVELKNRARWAVGSAGLVAAALAALVYTFWKEPSEVFADTIAVLPFEHSETEDSLLDGDHCQVMLHDALARWQGIRLVNTYQLNDARAKSGNERLTSESRLAMARKIGSRYAVWGHVRNRVDAIEVRAALYDVKRPTESAREYTVRVKRDLSDVAAKFGILADSLVARTVSDEGFVARGALETTSRDALQAYLRGHKALNVWNVRQASDEFRQAADADPSYASAHLWQAQTMSWTSDRMEDWRPAAKRTVALRERLPEREQTLSDGLLALSSGNHPVACELFGQLVARDSSDFAAWFGLGDCHRMDEVVIRTGNPSKWLFRGSYQAAVVAYREALERVPAVHLAFRQMAPERLGRILYTEPNRLRKGYAAGTDTTWFGAYASLDADTLAFYPQELDQNAGMLTPANLPAGSVAKAVSYSRSILRGIAQEWSRAFSASPEAHATVAQVLETSLQPEEALASTHIARHLAHDPRSQLQLGQSNVRLLLKLERFEEARALADSMLAWPAPDQRETDRTSGVAALVGKTRLAAAQLTRAKEYAFGKTQGGALFPPKVLTQLALELSAYASAGAPAASIRSLAERIDQMIPNYYTTQAEQKVARDALLVPPMSAAVPVLGPVATRYLRSDAGTLEQMQLAYARRDTSAVRSLFNALIARRARLGLMPGNVSIDYTFQEAWLLLAMHDTAGAAAHLDHTLNALPTLGTYIVQRVQEASGLVRAMALRAEIADARGERESAKRWARAVVALWSGADSDLKSVVISMREIATN